MTSGGWAASARTTPARTPLVVARDVTKTYRRGPESVHALRGVSFELFPGEVVGLVGPSGSGKSTLLNVLCGWEEFDGGAVAWPGDRATVRPVDRGWGDVGILPQRLGLVEELTVRENVELPVRLGRLRAAAADARERAARLMRSLGVEHVAPRLPDECSLGEQQRTALARALVLSPRLLLADEPTGHQDETFADAVFETLRTAAADGTSCFVATHNRELVAFADRVLAIRDGRLSAAGADAVEVGD